MTTYDAGTARSRFELDLTPLEASARRAKQILDDLVRQAQQAGRAQVGGGQGTAQSQAATRAAQGQAQALNQQAQALARAQREALSLAQAEARLLQAQGQLPAAIDRINQALAQQTERTRQVIAAETQRQRLISRNQQDNEPVLPRTIAGFSGAAASFAGAAGIGLGGAALAQGARDAALYATQIGQTEAVLRQLSGSQERYNTLMRIAAENQRLFGGSLAENYAPLTGVLALSNQTGASLEQLNSVTQLLLAKAPTKSASDAYFGLGEFLSGRGAEAALSLADQFNLSKDSIAALAQEGVSAEQRLAGLTRLLAEQGVTAETLAARLTDQAQAYNRLGASGEQAYIRLGNAANAVGVPLANFVSGGLEGFTTLVDRGNELAGLGGEILASAASYEQYGQIVTAQNAAMAQQWNLFGAQLPVLTEAQYNYARALAATGVAAEEASRRARSEVAAGTLDGSSAMERAEREQQAIAALQRIAESADPAVSGLSDRLYALAAAGGPAGEAALGVALAVDAGASSAAQAAATLSALEAATQAQAGAADGAAGAAERVAASLDLSSVAASAQRAALSEAAKAAYEARDAGGGLEDQAWAAAMALRGSGDAGEAAAAQLANSDVQLDRMAAAFYRLGDAARGAIRDMAGLVTVDTGGAAAAIDSANQRLEYQRALQRDIINATGTTAQRLAQVNRELAASEPYSDDRRRLTVEKARLEQQSADEAARADKAAADERERAGDRAAREAEQARKQREREAAQAEAEARREAESRLRELEQTQRQIERATEDHLDRLRKLNEDYALDASREDEDYQRQRQRLLAEGRIKEAQLLEEEYAIKRRRAEEDFARQQQREREQFAEGLDRTREDNARDTARLDRRFGEAPPATLGPSTPPALADTAAQQAALASLEQRQQAALATLPDLSTLPAARINLQVRIAPTSVHIGPEEIVRWTWPLFEQLVDAGLADQVVSVALTEPAAAGQVAGVGGPRP